MTLEEALAERLVTARPHPRLPLRIYNYTAKAQYGRVWNEITRTHRGLIVETATDLVVGRCLPKFFNLQEHRDCDWLPDLPAEPFVVMEKLDGSYVSVSTYEGEAVVATRGSFDGPQARWAAEIVHEKGGPWADGWTYIFELIHPQNRIVVDYAGRRDLIALAAFDPSGAWHPAEACPEQYDRVRAYPAPADPCELLAHVETNMEGFVLRFASGLYVKAKLEEYVKLHKVICGLSDRRIMEAVRDRQVDTLLEIVPDEFHPWLRETAAAAKSAADGWKRDAVQAFERIRGHVAETDRPGFAREACQYPELKSALFLLLDGKGIDAWSWKQVERSGAFDGTPLVTEEAA